MKITSAERNSSGVNRTVSPRGSSLRSRDDCRDLCEGRASPACEISNFEAALRRLSGSVEAERFLGYTPEFGDSALSLEACSVTVGSEVR